MDQKPGWVLRADPCQGPIYLQGSGSKAGPVQGWLDFRVKAAHSLQETLAVSVDDQAKIVRRVAYLGHPEIDHPIQLPPVGIVKNMVRSQVIMSQPGRESSHIQPSLQDRREKLGEPGPLVGPQEGV